MHSGRRPRALSLLAAIALTQASCAQKPPATDPRTTGSISTGNSAASLPPPATTGRSLEPVTDVESAVRRAINWHPAIREAAGKIKEQGELIADAKSGSRGENHETDHREHHHLERSRERLSDGRCHSRIGHLCAGQLRQFGFHACTFRGIE